VYWGGNPAECHPRHFTKYTIMQKSKFLPRGRKDRTMVLVDIRETKSAKAADIFLQIKPGKDFELSRTLKPLEAVRRFYVDSIVHSPIFLETIIKTIGESRVLLGSDWPFVPWKPSPGGWVENLQSLTQEEKEKILWRNLETLLKL